MAGGSFAANPQANNGTRAAESKDYKVIIIAIRQIRHRYDRSSTETLKQRTVEIYSKKEKRN